jgi:SAM-dependent methyltransferase
VADERARLRATFDSVADRYQRARPDYPEQVYEALVQWAGITAGDRLLEVGSATGKATTPLARLGFRITCIEIGPELAALARRDLAAFPDVHVVDGAFETTPVGTGFDLVFAATAWHWIDPTMRYRRAWESLRPGGHLAFWSATHAFPDGGDPFFVELQEVYDEIGEAPAEGISWPRPGDLPDQRDEIEGSGLFGDVHVRQFDWEVSYTAEEYVDLLDTFSGHIAMQAWQRDRLYEEIRRRLAQRPDGRLRRHWGAVLHVARRVERPDAS